MLGVKSIQIPKLKTIFFSCLGFISRLFTIHGTLGGGGGHYSSVPLPPASQILRDLPGDYWRELYKQLGLIA